LGWPAIVLAAAALLQQFTTRSSTNTTSRGGDYYYYYSHLHLPWLKHQGLHTHLKLSPPGRQT
jgi:hypothetical protein